MKAKLGICLLFVVVAWLISCDRNSVTPDDYPQDSPPGEEHPDSSNFAQSLPGSYWAEPMQRFQRRYYFRDEHEGELHYFGAHEGYIISVHEHRWNAVGDSIIFFTPFSGRIRTDDGDNWQDIAEDQMDEPYWYDTKFL